MIDPNLLEQERDRFFVQTRGGVFIPIIGVFFWTTLGIAGFFLSPEVLCIAVVYILAIVLAILVVFGKRLAKKLLNKSPLAGLILPAAVPILMSFGITVPLYFTDIALVPVAFVLGLSLHWPVIGWLYNRPGFSIHVLVRVILTVVLWYFLPTGLFTYLPISIGLLYLVTSIWILSELRRAKQNQEVD